MTSTTTRNFSSPFPTDRHHRFENFEGDSPFAEILMELAEEDCDDQSLDGKNIESNELTLEPIIYKKITSHFFSLQKLWQLSS